MAKSVKSYTAEEAAKLLSFDNDIDVSDLESDFSSSEDESDIVDDDSSPDVPICTANQDIEVIDDTGNSTSDIETDSIDNLNDSSPPRKVPKTSVSTRAKQKKKLDEVQETWFVLKNGENSESPFKWKFEPSRTPGVSPHIDNSFGPIDCFFELLTDDILHQIVKIINSYAKQKNRLNNPPRRRSIAATWKQIIDSELLRYLAIMIAMGLQPKPSIRDYWSKVSFYHTPWFAKTMPRERFEAIHHSMLHVSDVDEKKAKNKIEPFLNKVVNRFQSSFYPFEKVSIDEMVIKYKGRWKNRQYNPNKPAKYHIKTYGVCDSTTGYAFNILTYFGSETSFSPDMKDAGMSEKVFEYLLAPLGKGHHVYADRFYTTHKLLEYMTKKEFYYTGTLQTNRKNFPKEVKNSKIGYQEMKYFRSENGYLCVMWKDKKARKPVVAVSSKYSNDTIDVTSRHGKVTEKPTLIHEYNQSMNGCDRLDQLVSYYNNLDRKTVKWWKRIFMWIIEVSQVNAYIIYNLSRSEEVTKFTLKDFKHSLIESLCKKSHEIEDESIEDIDDDVVIHAKKHLVVYVNNDRNCAVCSVPGNRKRTNFVCSGCESKPYLHPKNCFQYYHSKNM